MRLVTLHALQTVFFYRYGCQAKADTTALHLAQRLLHLVQRLLNLGHNEMTWSLALLSNSVTCLHDESETSTLDSAPSDRSRDSSVAVQFVLYTRSKVLNTRLRMGIACVGPRS